MAYLEWSDRYSVKHQEIDQQHQRLIEMINTLHQALIARKGREIQCTIIDEMVKYAGTHFALEERLLQAVGYPLLSGHKAEHDAFSQKAFALQEEIRSDGFLLTLEILNFLKDWLQTHILGTDMLYVEHLRR